MKLYVWNTSPINSKIIASKQISYRAVTTQRDIIIGIGVYQCYANPRTQTSLEIKPFWQNPVSTANVTHNVSEI